MTFKVEVETVDSIRRRLAIEIPAEEVAAELDRTYADLGRAAKVRGFRPGHVPRPVLERLFGDKVQAETFGKLIQHSYSKVIEQRQIEALGQPEIVTEQARPGEALRYSAMVEVKPQIVVQGYSGIEVERQVPAIGDADVDAFIERLRESFAQLLPINDRSHVEDGDVVTLNYEARRDGRLLTRAENRHVEVGAGEFPPEFEAGVRGASVGAELSFGVKYPEDHGSPEVAGQTIPFKVHVTAISRKELPDVDDEFAKDHGECSTLEELRQRVRRQLEEHATRAADERVRQTLLTRLAALNDTPVPHVLVQQRTDLLVQEVLRETRQRRGRAPREADVVAQLRSQLEPRAHEQVKIGLLLEGIAQQEDIRVGEEDIEQRVEELVSGAGTDSERVRALYRDAEARRQLRGRLLQSRALDFVLGRAHVNTVVATTNVAEVHENR